MYPTACVGMDRNGHEALQSSQQIIVETIIMPLCLTHLSSVNIIIQDER